LSVFSDLKFITSLENLLTRIIFFFLFNPSNKWCQIDFKCLVIHEKIWRKKKLKYEIWNHFCLCMIWKFPIITDEILSKMPSLFEIAFQCIDKNDLFDCHLYYRHFNFFDLYNFKCIEITIMPVCSSKMCLCKNFKWRSFLFRTF